MDWLEAVSSWIGSLAWPVAVIVLAVLLKTPLSTALATLRHIEAPGVKADFGAVVADAEDRSESLKDSLPADVPASAAVEPDEGRHHAPAHDPSGVIIRAWQYLNDEVIKYARVSGLLREGQSRSVRFLIHSFQVNDLLDRDATITLLELRDLRNRVAHGAHVPTAGEAITYKTTAENVRRYVQFKREHDLAHGKGDEREPAANGPSAN